MSDDLLIDHPNAFQPIRPYRFRQLYFKGGKDKQRETADEKAFADVVMQKWNHYRTQFGGFEQTNMDRVDAMKTDEAQSFAEGVGNQHTQKEFGTARAGLRESLNASGVNPNSGRAKATMEGFSEAQGESAGEAMARAGNTQQDEYVQGVENIVAMGQGKATTAQAGLGGLADSAAQKAKTDAYNSFNNRAVTQQAVGTVAGAAAGYGLNYKKPEGP